jgi:hypothetical protein
MTVRIEKNSGVWTLIHSRPEAIEGSRRFASGKGRHGDFGDI